MKLLVIGLFVVLALVATVEAYPPTISYGPSPGYHYGAYKGSLRTIGTYSCNVYGCQYRADSYIRIRNQLDQVYYRNYNLRNVRYMDNGQLRYSGMWPYRQYNPYSLR